MAYSDDDKHGWNHPQCYPCWFKRWGLARDPVRLNNAEEEPCCYCGRPTDDGIFLRERPGSALIPFCPDQVLDRRLFWRENGPEPGE